jgi:hypothetical protein
MEIESRHPMTPKLIIETRAAVDNGPIRVSISRPYTIPPELGSMTRMVTLLPPSVEDEGRRVPLHLCLVVDTSGSMGAETSPSGQPLSERTGLSLLDIVKHAMRTILAAMDDRDQLSVISFSTNSHVLFSARKMDDAGQQQAIRDIRALRPSGQTNLCSGMIDGLDLIRNHADDGHMDAIFVLTDGVPNIAPPRGTVPCLRRYLDQHPVCSGCPISTFGFGYNLDSSQLVEIATVGGGMYSFIPDSGFIGTIFVNAISNLMTTAATHIAVDIHTQDESLSVVGYRNAQEKTATGYRVRVGTLQYGQARNLILRGALIDDAGVEVTGCISSGSRSSRLLDCPFCEEDDGNTHVRIEGEVLRCEVVQAISTQDACDMEALGDIIRRVEEFVLRATNAHVPPSHIEPSQSLLEDLTGQVSSAYSRGDWFDRWGRHYLPSLVSAHQAQQCNNFKDPGVQHYGGEMFRAIQDRVDGLFCELPAPEPAYAHADRVRGGGHAPVSMRSFHNSAGGCVSPASVVALAGGQTKRADEIVQGDVVVCDAYGHMADVVCVVKMICTSMEFVVLSDGLDITPWHPVRWNRRWRFPMDVGSCTKTLECDAVYNLVLDRNHTVLVGGVECITLGHGMCDDVARHDYFGTQRVIDVLMTCAGWENGAVELAANSVKRCEDTGIIIGHRPVL